jgi:hypothetical protein
LHEENEKLNVGYTLAVHDKSSIEVQVTIHFLSYDSF